MADGYKNQKKGPNWLVIAILAIGVGGAGFAFYSSENHPAPAAQHAK